MLGAADTFRAAAADQLETWGAKVGVPVVRSDKDGADPASVAFEASAKAKEENADVLIIDTAGRLQNKANLMDELGKIRRVTEKNLPVDEVLLVLDATTGQNGMTQAKVFAEAIGITGVVLSKLDGSAKGGIVISVQKELGVPVKLVGLGEGPDDLAPFDPEASSTASSPELIALPRKPPRVGGFLFTPDQSYFAYIWQICRFVRWFLAYIWQMLLEKVDLEGICLPPKAPFLRVRVPYIGEMPRVSPPNLPYIRQIR